LFQGLEQYDVAAGFSRVREVFLEFLPWYRARYSERECPIPKAIALNLHWNGRPLPRHPRQYLYDALPQLLAEQPSIRQLRHTLFCNARFVERFYALQRRFS
ncbi:MAG: hypothetical protein U9P12_06375, partial [Verrucomicrobiota bacterium]|nr:hypothetical protein [Verrucomicrobiota bacterium]